MIGRTSHVWMLTATLALSLTVTSAHAQSDPASTVKPLVVFLLDTSGSMEYESGNATNEASEFTVPLCEEPNATSPNLFGAGDFPASRLIVAKEVLTGSYRDYWCRYDYRDSNPDAVDFEYPVPHVRACYTHAHLRILDSTETFGTALLGEKINRNRN